MREPIEKRDENTDVDQDGDIDVVPSAEEGRWFIGSLAFERLREWIEGQDQA